LTTVPTTTATLPSGNWHTFLAYAGITDYLTNGGHIKVAKRSAGHSNASTTSLYDRCNDDISVRDVERIGI
jgi:integrase/recombinase XerD